MTIVRSPQPSPRDQVIAGLRDLADFLEQHPDVPVNSFTTVAYSVDNRAEPGKRRPEVDRIAEILDVDAADDGHYRASRMFGPVEYVAVSTRPEACCANCGKGTHR